MWVHICVPHTLRFLWKTERISDTMEQVLCAIVSHPHDCLEMDLVPTRKQQVFLIAETLDF